MAGSMPLRPGRLLAGRVGGMAGALVAGQVLVGVTFVLAARNMDPADLGLVATCLAIGMIAATVFDLGLTNYTVREVAAGHMTMDDARSLVRAKRRLMPLLVVPTTAACVLIMPAPVDGLVLGLVGWVLWEAQTANSLLRAQERFAGAAGAQLVGRAFGLLVTAALLVALPAALALSVGVAASFALEALLNRAFLGPHRAPPARQARLAAVHRRSLSFGLVSLAAIGQQLDTPLVTLGGGAAAGGIYAGAGRLLGPLLFLSSSMALVGAPWLARAQHDPAALRCEERRILRASLVLSLGPLGAAAVGPTVIPLLLGDRYVGSGWAFSILAIGALFSTVSQALAIILQNRGAERTVATTIVIGLVIGLVSTYVLAVLGGPVWAAVGFAVSQVYILAHLAVATRRRTHAPPSPSAQQEGVGR